MSFVSKKASGKDYPYFRAGGEGQYYLGRPGNPNVPNILKSLDYVKSKSDHYFEVEKKLIEMLPEPERKEYLSKRTAELLAWIRRLEEIMKTDSVSMTGAGVLISTSSQRHIPLSSSRSHNAPSVKKSKKKTKKRKKKETDKDEK